jgi:hypothetical protein
MTLFDSLNKLSNVNIHIEVDVDSLLAGKFKAYEHEAKMRVFSEDNEVLNLPLKISIRSKSRRIHCDFPPLKFNFKKGNLEKYGLDRRDTYKIVTHCLDDPSGEEILLKEYMVYEMYRMITPVSLGAKLVDITYTDVYSNEKLETKAIILESEKEFAKKLEGKMCDCFGTGIDEVDPFLYEQLAMFQYMIGNIDYDHVAERNIKFVRQKSEQPMIPVPYDFDFAALVNAPYVFPEIRNNRFLKRSYLGYPGNKWILEPVMKQFLAVKDDLLSYIEDFPHISKREKKSILLYIKKFYKEIETPGFEFPYREGHF